MNLSKLKIDAFIGFDLTTTKLRSILGGTSTRRSGIGDGTDGPDFINDCDVTTFSNGTTSNTDVIHN